MREPDTLHWREKTYEVIFGHGTPAGKAFDVVLIIAILASVAAVMLDSVADIRKAYGGMLEALEWFITALFTIEYVLRLISARGRRRYAFTFYGIIDLLAVLPTWLSLFIPGSKYLAVIRVVRVIRVFRILKLVTYLGEASLLTRALQASRRRITVFVVAVLCLVVIFGSLMYLIEGEENGFTSIPRSVYWAIVTLTTVGYGDIAPKTALGQIIASVMMIVGYGIIAVPTGIVTVEMTRELRRRSSDVSCPSCGQRGHDADARFCKSCGSAL